MPERRGRKRRRDRTPRGDAPRAPTPGEGAQTATSAPSPQVPSNMARLSGVAIAAVTEVIAVMLIAGALSGDHAAADATMRIAAAVFLIVLGVVVGALSLFPLQLRRLVRGS